MSQPTTEAPVPTASTPTEPAAAAPQTTPTPPAAGEWDGKVESLPGDVQKMIRDLRSEAASNRTTAKETAAAEARNALAQEIGKALGLVKDEAVDPAALTQQLTAKDAEAQQAKVALAVYQAAGAAGGDPSALLDSSSFLAKVNTLDPSDGAAIAAAVTEAVTANPRLGATPVAPGVPAPNPAQGSAASGAPGFDEQIAAATKAGNHQLAIALKQRKAASLKT